MDILLVNPPRVTKSGNIWHGINSTWPPLGLLYIAAYAESRGWSVQVMDATAEKLDFGQIEEFVREHRPPFVGVTSVTAQIGGAHRIAELVKRASPGSRVVLGGVHPTALPEEVLQDRHVDYVIRGEGEEAFANLVGGQPPESIEGLCYRSNNPLEPIRQNGTAAPIEDLDSLPPPAYHLIRFDLYKPAVGSYRRLPAMALTMTRGCPGRCIFCNSARIKLRSRSAERVVDEIQMLQNRYGIREISFYDDTLTIFKQNVARMCDLIVERGVDVTWSCFARTDCLAEPLLRKMRAAGCHQILLGIESADEGILKAIGKPINLNQARRAVKMVQEVGIAARTTFMFGNPGETVASMRRTIEFARDLEPDIALFNITTPYPGTQMFDWAKERGYLRTLDWNEYDLANAVVELPTVSSEQVNEMYRTAYRQFYFRPRYLLGRLLRLSSMVDVKMSLQALVSVLRARATGPSARPPVAADRTSPEHQLPLPSEPVAGAYA